MGFKFTQLGRPFRTLELSGNAAPHGRPRVGPVATPEQRLRENEVYLAGSDEPVVHIFGQRREPIKIHGRFRSRRLGGPGTAMLKHEEVKRFFSDQQTFQMVWEDFVDVVGLMVGYVPKIESENEIEYEIEVKVIRDNLDPPPQPPVKVRAPADIVNQLIAAIATKDDLPLVPPTLKGSVSDVLDGLVGSLNSATAALVAASVDIDSFVTSTVTSLRRFRAGLGQTAVAISNVRHTYDDLLASAALESEDATQSQKFWDLQAAWASGALEAERLIAEADRQAAQAQRSTTLAFHEAGAGDTWESISGRWFNGSPARAKDIREANGVPAGTDPVPGTIYLVPR